jgi:hypothetical protein
MSTSGKSTANFGAVGAQQQPTKTKKVKKAVSKKLEV